MGIASARHILSHREDLSIHFDSRNYMGQAEIASAWLSSALALNGCLRQLRVSLSECRQLSLPSSPWYNAGEAPKTRVGEIPTNEHLEQIE